MPRTAGRNRSDILYFNELADRLRDDEHMSAVHAEELAESLWREAARDGRSMRDRFGPPAQHAHHYRLRGSRLLWAAVLEIPWRGAPALALVLGSAAVVGRPWWAVAAVVGLVIVLFGIGPTVDDRIGFAIDPRRGTPWTVVGGLGVLLVAVTELAVVLLTLLAVG